MRIDRMLTIIVILLNRQKITAKELADKFEVSVRTVYRDLEAINMAGIPVISYPGNNGGYGIMENYKLNHQLLTLNNLCSMLTALKGMNSSLEDIEIDASIEKLRNLIPKDKSQEFDLQMEQIIIEKQPWVFNSNQRKHIKGIREAISQSQLLTITYRNYKNETSTRQIEPMSLIFKSYSWYLYAYCRLKDDYRIFKMSRILDLKNDEFPFSRRTKSYQEFDASSNLEASVTSITLKFSSQVQTKVKDIFESENIKLLNTGEMIVTAPFPMKDWYLSFIFSFGEHVEVLGPEKVRNEVAERVQSMYEIYHKK